MADPGRPDPAEVLRRVFGYDQFRGQQQDIIEHVVSGGDALVLMPTGGGKSLCYQIPAIVRRGVGVVISPLIALMQDQVSALLQAGVKAAFLNSTLDLGQAAAIEGRVRRGELDLVYVAPERLMTARFQQLLHESPLALFAIDEAHCVSQWGHDFRPEYMELRVLHERFPEVPRIALTATADEPTRREIAAQLGLREARAFISGFDRPNIRYRVVPKQRPKAQLEKLIEGEHPGDAGIVYCLSRKRVEETAEWLAGRGHLAVPYHAGLDSRVRQANQDRFLLEEGIIVVATVAFGMGIDKPNVRFVAHLDPPKSIEAYYQETGRAGRDGLPADAFMCYGLGDITMLRRVLMDSDADEQRKRVEQAKLNALLGYCETTECRRRVLLSYFGERLEEPCGNCDTCLEPVESWDGTVAAQKALSCVFRTGQRFGTGHLIDVLLGHATDRTRSFGHERIKTFGIGRELSAGQWLSVFRQLVAAGYLAVDIDGYGGLFLLPESRPVLAGDQTVELRKDPPVRKKPKKTSKARPSGGRAAPSASPIGDGPWDAELWESLRARRLELSRAQGVPPYVVFHDSTLTEMVHRQPATLSEMAGISGVGASKLERYGQAFLDVIAAHVGG